MKIIALTRYSRKGASSRMRFHIFFQELLNQGFTIQEKNLLDDEYLKNMYSGNKKNFIYLFQRYLRRLLILGKVFNYDLIWLEKELFPNFPAIFERVLSMIGIKVVVDFDDAVFHNYDQIRTLNPIKLALKNKIDVVMRTSNLVVCGNSYIAERAKDSGAQNVCVIPTIVDIDKYRVKLTNNDKPIIGWIGTPVTDHSLDIVIPALEELSLKYDFSVMLIGSDRKISNINTINIPWSEENEAKNIENIDIGIMPLKDHPMEKGKCGYKLIQYMASGKPVIGSSVGANKEIIRDGVNGFLVTENKDWVRKLEILITDQQTCLSYGNEGRKLVEKKYNLNIALELLVKEFNKLKLQS